MEHSARRQLEEQEAARIRQLQMMQKLEVMRQQKRVCRFLPLGRIFPNTGALSYATWLALTD